MPKEINEDFGLEDRNFHPEKQLIHSVIRKKGKKVKQDIEPELDRDLDNALDEEIKDYSDEDFDKKDTSDA